MKPAPTFRSRRAFTLVEILVAMGILSLVLTAIFSSWTAILRASKSGLNAAAEVQRARIAGRTIEQSLGSAILCGANESYYSFVAENGDNASLSFVAHLSPSFPRQGKFEGLDIRRVTFAVEKGRLVLRQCPIMMEPDIDEKQHPLVLASHVKEFKTEFWDKRMQDWTDEWKQTNTLPSLVKVTLELGDTTYATRKGEIMTRIVSLPAMAMAPAWQMSRLPTAPVPGGPLGASPGFQLGVPPNAQPGPVTQ